MDNGWHKKSSQIIYEDKWLKVHKDIFVSDENKKEYTLVDRKNSVVVIPLTHDNKTILQQQFRMAVLKPFWEFPMGGVESSQTIEEAARRELEEETNIKPESFEHIGGFYPIPGLTSQYADVFVTHVSADQLDNLLAKDDTEGIMDYMLLPVKEVISMVGSGEIIEGFTLMALMKLIGSEYGNLFSEDFNKCHAKVIGGRLL